MIGKLHVWHFFLFALRNAFNYGTFVRSHRLGLAELIDWLIDWLIDEVLNRVSTFYIMVSESIVITTVWKINNILSTFYGQLVVVWIVITQSFNHNVVDLLAKLFLCLTFAFILQLQVLLLLNNRYFAAPLFCPFHWLLLTCGYFLYKTMAQTERLLSVIKKNYSHICKVYILNTGILKT